MAVRPSPAKARQIKIAMRGVEPLPEEPLPVLVGGGVEPWTGVAVSPWNDWNGDELGMAVSPWKDWNGVGFAGSVGRAVGGAVISSVGAALLIGLAVTIGGAVSPWNDWNGVGLAQPLAGEMLPLVVNSTEEPL